MAPLLTWKTSCPVPDLDHRTAIPVRRVSPGTAQTGADALTIPEPPSWRPEAYFSW